MALIFTSLKSLKEHYGPDNHTTARIRPFKEQFPCIISWDKARMDRARVIGYVITQGTKHVILRVTTRKKYLQSGENRKNLVLMNDWNHYLFQTHLSRQFGNGLLKREPDFIRRVDDFCKGL